MGKKARKTRWRTLSIADDHSDSEESSTTTAPRLPNAYQQKAYYNKFPYSSQSTPRRRYQQDGIKSTRSSSTASENKITFNEDEYTKITTPRQDVLFKKGYLNKPRNYQTQTSTGTSTTSTGNSTGNGTPDYQSTDLEYESQFVFPNGFVDQNGVYYLNGYDSYPLMFYNVPTYYPEYSTNKSKRHSSGSLTESTSPNNEEVTSQDLSSGEASNNLSDYSGHHNVYNVVYTGYYADEFGPTDGPVREHNQTEQSKRIKKRRRRKSSLSQKEDQDSSECSEDENDVCTDEEKVENNLTPTEILTQPSSSKASQNGEQEEIEAVPSESAISTSTSDTPPDNCGMKEHVTKLDEIDSIAEPDSQRQPLADNIGESDAESQHLHENDEEHEKTSNSSETKIPENSKNPTLETFSLDSKPQKYNLKPDAEEFVPRAFRQSEVPLSPVQLIKIPPNFVPIPIVPFNGSSFNPTFIPPGIPINFVPPDLKLFPNLVGFAQNSSPTPNNEADRVGNNQTQITTKSTKDVEDCDNSNTANHVQSLNEDEENKKIITKSIDIATIVSKLEEAAKEQEEQEYITVIKSNESEEESPKKHIKKFRNNVNYKRNYYGSLQNSPKRENYYQNKEVSYNGSPQRRSYGNNQTITNTPRGSPLRQIYKVTAPTHQQVAVSNGQPETRSSLAETQAHSKQNIKRFTGNTPDKFKRSWKATAYQNGVNYKWQHQNGSDFKQKSTQREHQDCDSQLYSKNHLETLKAQVSNTKSQKICEEVKPSSRTSKSSKIEKNIPLSKMTGSVTLPNQWISVHSKKKRKNKGTEENDATFEETESQYQNDQFQSYDVNLLVDVIPVHQTGNENPETKEDLLEVSVDSVEFNETDKHYSLPDIEHIDQTQNYEKFKPDEQKDIKFSESEAPRESTDGVQVITEYEFATEINNAMNKSSKKKSKKGTQKSVTKRVIITDADLSDKITEIKSPIKKIVKKIDKVIPQVNTVAAQEPEKCDLKTENTVEEIGVKKIEVDLLADVPNGNEDEKKKSKKKKKKAIKESNCNESLSSSSATLNAADDSYDFLDSVLVGELEEKTNDEISQELDKMIQKGMFSSLEDKIKSLNIDETEGFFKSMFTNITPKETNVGYSKIPDFSEILLNTRTSMAPSSVSDEVKHNSLSNDLEFPTQDGFFLENPGLVETLENQSDIDSNKTETRTTAEEIKVEQVEQPQTLYPITKAVKEWMNKTRETTPDVDILKSPHTIYKEFCDSASDSETATEIGELSVNIDDEEITIFTTEREQSVDQQDFMDYWEDLVEDNVDNNERQNVPESENAIEEVVDIYQSKYGKNEDFLEIQKEVHQKITNSGPKGSGLPHRGVCCNIM